MVDREQEQARLMADAMGANGRAGRDLAWIVSFGVVLVVLAIATGAVDRFLEWANGLAGTNVNGLLALLVLVPIGATIYAIRRYHDASVAREQLHELSYHDSLTGLPNRRFLGEGFDEMLKSVRRYNGRVGVFFIDLDGFKKINDTYGHDVGDEALKRIAYVLSTCLKNEAIVGRLGGEEFGVFLPKATGSEVTDAAQALVEAMRQHGQTVGEHALNMTISIGGAEHIDGQPLEMTMKLADTALYQAKRSGRDRYVIATADVTMPGLLKRSASEMAKDAQRPEQASSAA